MAGRELAPRGAETTEARRPPPSRPSDRVAEDLGRLVFENAPSAVITMDAGGLITGWNREAERTFGWTAAEVTGRGMAESIIPERFRQEQTARLRHHRRGGGGEVLGRGVELTAVRRSGEEFPAEVMISPAAETAAGPAFVGLVRDMTERHRAQVSQERHTRDVEQNEKLKSDFLHLASHELRAPISVLRGYISMLDDGEFADRPVPRPIVEALTQKVGEMATLVDQMMETSRIEEGKLQLDRRPLDLADLVRRVAAGIAIASPRHEVQVRGPDGLEVHADRIRLEAVVRNLLDNAVKYSPAGGPIHCDLEAGERTARLSVSDQGIGIAAEHLDRLFGRFQRVPAEAGRGIPGTGLGLYVAREQARAHGGDITVVSTPGAGSVFTLTLPL
ncbi:MAG TPA: PAS domain-containing sensor histidine kinase [Candidatus Dormibacteraeota bacterium]|nr:PAS domain-containing sensor histidine kinase [Candidatus Dormibacteraeota bacterium]